MADGGRAKQSSESNGWRPVLRRMDQAVVALLILCALVGMGVYWVVQGGPRGDLIEIDRAEPLSARYLVDLNKAEWPELAEIPDIGETLARRIVEMRETRGAFKDHNELRRVRGIGPRTLEKLKPYLLPLPDQQDVAGGAKSQEVN
ncbi:MAG TPA: helix-hairpin-helix domain-containing protein [Lacipirellulaceae bacterium]|jgi:competence protein ComEA|nr:helix-hairpin-helix domain-containing protein [Lacipirellulaceae bacterium]